MCTVVPLNDGYYVLPVHWYMKCFGGNFSYCHHIFLVWVDFLCCMFEVFEVSLNSVSLPAPISLFVLVCALWVPKIIFYPSFLLLPKGLSITSICLNGSNYAQRTQAVEFYQLGRKKFH